MKRKIKLSEYALLNSITYKTALIWFKNGKIKEDTYTSNSGGLYVYIPDYDNVNAKQKPVYIYTRVSSHNKKDDLNRQYERCMCFAKEHNYNIAKSFKEIASGMNDNRTQFNKLLEQNAGIIIVENKDRLTRFGFNYINNLYSKLGGEIIVINNDENDENDLMKDLISIITSFCCRLYGMHRGYAKVKKIQKEINKNK